MDHITAGKSKISIGLIGLGGRGAGLLSMLLGMDDVEVAAVCDLYEDRAANAVMQVTASGKPAPKAFLDHRQAVLCKDVDCVITSSSWSSHTRVLTDALKAGKPAATEVGGASSVQECWDIVRTSEETGIPCMMLENCCYGREELALLTMARQNVFGELIHCQGAYSHDLRKQVATGLEARHYRYGNYRNRNGELYPTHALGPIAKLLNINHGNRFVSLASTASKSRGINLWAREHLGIGHPAANESFMLGDVVTTVIKCARGETIVLTHDTSLPRPYSRGGRVQGTKGIWMEDNHSIYIEGISPDDQWEPFQAYLEKYEHPLWRKSSVQEYVAGHGGMDYLVLRAFIESVHARAEMPINAYDTATWMAVTALSEQSIALGGAPVAFPDFTNGRWIGSMPGNDGLYSLDQIPSKIFSGSQYTEGNKKLPFTPPIP